MQIFWWDGLTPTPASFLHSRHTCNAKTKKPHFSERRDRSYYLVINDLFYRDTNYFGWHRIGVNTLNRMLLRFVYWRAMYSYSLYKNIRSARKCIFSAVEVSEALFLRIQSSSGHEISFFISLVPAVTLNSTQTWTPCTSRRKKKPL